MEVERTGRIMCLLRLTMRVFHHEVFLLEDAGRQRTKSNSDDARGGLITADDEKKAFFPIAPPPAPATSKSGETDSVGAFPLIPPPPPAPGFTVSKAGLYHHSRVLCGTAAALEPDYWTRHCSMCLSIKNECNVSPGSEKLSCG